MRPTLAVTVTLDGQDRVAVDLREAPDRSLRLRFGDAITLDVRAADAITIAAAADALEARRDGGRP